MIPKIELCTISIIITIEYNIENIVYTYKYYVYYICNNINLALCKIIIYIFLMW